MVEQIEERQYRARVPRHASMVHEFAFIFCSKFCNAAVRTLNRNAMDMNWVANESVTSTLSQSMIEVQVDEEDGDADEEDSE